MKKWLLAVGLAAGMVACSKDNEPVIIVDDDDTTTVVVDDEDDLVENSSWNQTVSIVWNGASASVTGATDSVTVTEKSGVVTVNSMIKHVEYVLSGSGTGQLNIYSDYKLKLALNGLSLTCSDGPAINNQSHKRTFVVLEGANTLADGTTYATSDEDRKAALFSEGQLIFSGSGALTVTGNYKHAVASDDYVRVVSGTLNLTAKVSDGIHANDGVIFNGGATTIVAADEGIQCDSATIAVAGGSLAVTAVNKGIKALGDISISGGDVLVIAGTNSSTYAPPGPGGGPGGDSSSGAEGIESKAAMTISGGRVFVQATDDAINSGGDLTISGGYVCAYSTGNDGIDANGDCYIKGGVVYAIGARSPEVAIDANSEDRKQLYVQGGTIVAIGGLESGASLTQSCYQASSWTANKWYALTVGSDTFCFLTPASGGTTLVVSAASKPSMKSGVSVTSGTSIFNEMGAIGAAFSGGTDVSLSDYSGNSGGGGRW